MLATLTEFLAPYRDGVAAAHETHEKERVPEATRTANPPTTEEGPTEPLPKKRRSS